MKNTIKTLIIFGGLIHGGGAFATTTIDFLAGEGNYELEATEGQCLLNEVTAGNMTPCKVKDLKNFSINIIQKTTNSKTPSCTLTGDEIQKQQKPTGDSCAFMNINIDKQIDDLIRVHLK